VNLIHALAHPHPAAPTFHRDRPHRTRPLPTHCRLPATAIARQPLPPLRGSHRRWHSEGVTTIAVALNSPRGTIRADDRTTPEPSDCATRHPPTGDPCHPLSQHPPTGTLGVGAPGGPSAARSNTVDPGALPDDPVLACAAIKSRGRCLIDQFAR
jgi:hypothetical protein